MRQWEVSCHSRSSAGIIVLRAAVPRALMPNTICYSACRGIMPLVAIPEGGGTKNHARKIVYNPKTNSAALPMCCVNYRFSWFSGTHTYKHSPRGFAADRQRPPQVVDEKQRFSRIRPFATCVHPRGARRASSEQTHCVCALLLRRSDGGGGSSLSVRKVYVGIHLLIATAGGGLRTHVLLTIPNPFRVLRQFSE